MDKIRILRKDFDIGLVELETEESFKHLKDFLFEDCKDFIQHKLCATYGFFIEEKLKGYISICTWVIKIQSYWLFWKETDYLEWVRFPIPWILIWKLLIDKNSRWNWMGQKLVSYILAYAYEISNTIWARFIIVDANNTAIGFYEKQWFISIDSWKDTTKMVFDLAIYDSFTNY